MRGKRKRVRKGVKRGNKKRKQKEEVGRTEIFLSAAV